MKFATAYVAADRGLFKKYGLDVELEKVKSGTEAIAFMTQGSVDVGGIAIVTSLWNSWNRGLAIRIIAPGGLEPMQGSPTDLLVSKKAMDAGVKTLADLKGKKIAAAGGPGSGSRISDREGTGARPSHHPRREPGQYRQSRHPGGARGGIGRCRSCRPAVLDTGD